ncbi:MAG TPA: prepilin-type N-terminal cleavage/methylation domain-containing protein [Solirubrobacteraceae bacterium]
MRRPRHHLADDRGFTLVELLVALSAGIVVLFGATSLIIVSFHFSSRIADSVNAVQEGRTAMEQLLQELNSGCLVNDVSPVQATTAAGITPAVNTDGNDLVFVTGLGDSATATPTEHVIAIQNGALIDTAYPNTGGSPPALNTPATWTFSATPKLRRILLERVTQINGSTPLFQYLSFANASNPTANSLVNAAPLSPLPLTAVAAPSVAEVDIAWQAGPSDGLTDPTRALAIRDSAVFRLTPASPTGTNYPCD